MPHIELWLGEHLVDPLMFFLPIAIGIVGSLQSMSNWILPLVIFNTFIYYLYHRKNKRNKSIEEKLLKLETENAELRQEKMRLDDDLAASIQDMRSLCEGYLYALAEGPLKFSESKGSHERITLYLYDQSGRFLSVGRYSRNPEYRKTGRPVYPPQGVISSTWKNGWCFANDYPDPQSNPVEFYERCKEDGIPKSVAKELGMPSRLYYGYRISNTQGRDDLAVIIMESTNPTRYSEEELKNLFEDKERVYLRELTERFSKWMPNLKDTKDRGL